MAEKKSPKKATEAKNIEALQSELATKRQDLLEAQRGHAAGELANPRVLSATRKEIARLLTAINSLERAAKESK